MDSASFHHAWATATTPDPSPTGIRSRIVRIDGSITSNAAHVLPSDQQRPHSPCVVAVGLLALLAERDAALGVIAPRPAGGRTPRTGAESVRLVRDCHPLSP